MTVLLTRELAPLHFQYPFDKSQRLFVEAPRAVSTQKYNITPALCYVTMYDIDISFAKSPNMV